jgi:hypothetical protein
VDRPAVWTRPTGVPVTPQQVVLTCPETDLPPVFRVAGISTSLYLAEAANLRNIRYLSEMVYVPA